MTGTDEEDKRDQLETRLISSLAYRYSNRHFYGTSRLQLSVPVRAICQQGRDLVVAGCVASLRCGSIASENSALPLTLWVIFVHWLILS